LRSSAVDVQAAIQLAKMTAIRENTDVVLTFDPSNNSYLVFIDNDYDNVVELTDENGTQDAGEPTIRSKEMSPGIDLVSTGFPADTITLNSRGLEGNNNSGSITLRNNLGQNTIVTVTVTGMSRIN
jgi:Tfp pilus assembly protein FimT